MAGSIAPTRRKLSATPIPIGAAGLSALFLVISVAVVAYLLDQAATRENALARAQSIHIANSAMRGFTEQLANMSKDYAWWDDTVAFVNGGKPAQWAEDNIGKYLQKTFEVTGSFVVQADGTTIFQSTALDASVRAADASRPLQSI